MPRRDVTSRGPLSRLCSAFAARRTRARSLDDLFLERLTRAKGRAINTASRPAELSIELPELGHGIFTYYLIRGLQGAADLDRDGVVTLQELYQYLEQEVTRRSRAAGGNQHPVMKGELEGVLPLGEGHIKIISLSGFSSGSAYRSRINNSQKGDETMRFNPPDGKWNKCRRYLWQRMDAETLRGQRAKVWKAFVKFCGNEKLAREALQWGRGPLIELKALVGACGEMAQRKTPWESPPDLIFIDTRTAGAYEFYGDASAWESTVLHELVHWARSKQKGLDDQFIEDPSNPGGGYLEVGKGFEKAAYGEDIDCWRVYKSPGY